MTMNSVLSAAAHLGSGLFILAFGQSVVVLLLFFAVKWQPLVDFISGVSSLNLAGAYGSALVFRPFLRGFFMIAQMCCQTAKAATELIN
jgi:hypothetical protein